MLIIDNGMVKEILSMKECIEIQEVAFKALETGKAIHRPRIDMYAPTGRVSDYYRWGTMEGWYDDIFAIRMKSDIVAWPQSPGGKMTESKYCIRPGTYCGLIMLFSSINGEPLSIINDGLLQHMRVGGGAGLGAKLLARTDATTVGMLGSGGMARSYLEAFCAVRPIKKCKIFSPTRKNREAFADEMSVKLGIKVDPVDSAREAVRNVDILSSATDSMTPTFEAEWLEPGMHVAVLGPGEVSEEVEARFDVKIRQGIVGLRLPETDRIRMAVGMSPIAWVAGSKEQMESLPKKTKWNTYKADYPDFCDLTFGRAQGRTSDKEVTFYLNMGNQGLQFASVGGLVYRKAKALDIGRQLPAEWMLQDIRD